MIFPESSLRGREYRSLAEDVQKRAAGGCAKNEDGTFAIKNQCQDDAGTSASPSSPKRSESWKSSSEREVKFTREQLKQSSPVSGGERLDSLTVHTPSTTAPLMSRLGVSDLDTVVSIGGGAVRGASVEVLNADDEAVLVKMNAPVDPADPASPTAKTTVWIMEELDGSGTVVDYSNFNSGGRAISDASGQDAGENSSRRLRVASVLKQRMLESLMTADGAGVKKAVTMAVGSLNNPEQKGYRLWPQFGFDADLPRSVMDTIPDDVLLQAAGIKPPVSRIPLATLLKGLRSQVKKITVQQLMAFRDGENWWTKNGSSMEMTLDLKDKSSLGYKRFQEEQKKLPSLRRRNEGRSWYPIDDFERRSCEGSDKDETGRFASGNDCGAETGGGSPRPPSRARREQWRKSEEEQVILDAKSLKEGSPVIGGERLNQLKIVRPKKTAQALDRLGVKDLDTAVKIGGGAVRGSDVKVQAYGTDGVVISISSPVDPDDEDAGSVSTTVDLADYGNGLEVFYAGLSTPKRVSDAAGLDAGARDKTRLRIASLMQERMIESLMSAQKAGAFRASAFAAGDSEDPYYQGYRLWPQFGFDAKLDLTEQKVPAEIILAAFKKQVPESEGEAAKQAKKLTAKGFTLQQLISTREGKKWWDDNGSGIDMTIELKNKSSLGYKKLTRLKKLLPKLKSRNAAEGRSLLGWLIEEVGRRSMSLMSFFGGLSAAFEQRSDCGPSDKDESGKFTKGNDCQEGAGGGEKPESGGQNPKPLIWTPGQSAGLVTSKTRESLTAVRSDDGKRIISTPIPGAHVYKGRGARQFVGTVDVGGALASEQDAIRGEKINTGKEVLGGPESEYILASLEEQVRGAMERGIEPKFYSPEEREDQLAAFAEMIPEVRGGRTKAGAMVEQEDAENLFRVLQAITSPNASPLINMQRTDSLLQKFFYGDGLVTTSDSLGVTGEGIKKSLRRFQKIVDTLGKRTDGSIDTAAGLRGARELLQGRSLRTGDVKKFFEDFASPGEKKGAWVPSSYLVDEVVPVFSTFGPKVGPFYANNNGDLDPLTADVWFSRTWGRVTGELVVPGSPTKSADQATKLAKVIGKASDDQLHGISGADLADAIKQTGETGAVSDLLRAWSGARLRHYAKGGYKEKTGTGGKLNQIAKNIVENDTALIGDPGSGSRRSHMIRLMREVSQKTGTPVAYLQDILWQDEQDAYGALGAMTATNVDEPSLYSDQIKRLAANNGKSRKPRAKVDRGYRRDYEQPEPFFDDYERGGREQMLWEAALAHLGDEEFAKAVIKLAENARPTEESREERRNFAALDVVVEIRSADCGRQEGGKFGSGNQCQEEGSDPGPQSGSDRSESLKSAVIRWKGSTSDIGIHVQDELDGKPVPSSGTGKKLREMASSLLAEVQTNSEPAPKLYRGDDKPPSGNSSPLLGWTSNKKAAERWARTYGGQVYELDGAAGVNLKKIAGDTLDGGEDEWIVMNKPARKNSRSSTSEFRGDAPAPKKDQITGSDKNAKNSASGKSGSIELKDSTITALKTKAKDHNASTKEAGKANWTRVRVSSLKAVFRRGAGAFSVSHRPGMTRDQWAMARVNAFLTLARRGRPENAKYVGDNDLLHSDHPKYSESRSADCGRQEGGKFGPKNQCQEDGSGAGAIKREAFESSFVNTKRYIPGEEELKQTESFAGTAKDYASKAGLLAVSPEEAIQNATQSQLMTSREVRSAIARYQTSWLPGDIPKILEERVSRATLLGGTPPLYRGMRLTPEVLDGVISQGSIAHGSIQSWSFSPSTAATFASMRNPFSKDFARVILVDESPRRGLVHSGDDETFEVIVPAGEEKIAKVVRVSGPEGELVFLHLRRRREPLNRSDDGAQTLVLWNSPESRFVAVRLAEDSESRSADCGRQEGGKFGPKNQCQEDSEPGGGGQATLPAQWSPASGDEPFEGASRYSGVSSSGGERVAKSLEKMGVEPGDAIAASGAPERADVTLRTAPEFAANETFAGGEAPPVFMDFTADVAGIRRGMAGSSVLGSRKNEATGQQEKVLYHNVFEVLPAVQQDAGRRHAAARAVYRAMVASIESARTSGIAEIKFSAAGNAVDAAEDKTAFKGYTIWPRMGFDAKLPDRIRSKLPESLAHATSLLDLHATREGTQWWAENGEDIDVSLRLGDRSSPQNKIIDRFIKHFMKERREMPLGAGDGWLSPEDLLRLDEMWQEVWDGGDLDDYEYVEQRSADAKPVPNNDRQDIAKQEDDCVEP